MGKIDVKPETYRYATSDEADRAIKVAVIDALRDHKRAGNPVAIWEDGKVRIVPPEEIVLPEEATTE